ncbi:MAG: YiiX/YebB-like N1pC/P60 family cysteine hydrolase [Hyphomonas sp.]|nr:hypothetical protein [Hyphomonas sp.]MCB9963116.1 hypothetical protein [Hyphomonas sp.]MCB9970134.1 hypothetical protein [Hyphomonas sp.]
MLQQVVTAAAFLAFTAGAAEAKILPAEAGPLRPGELLFKGSATGAGTRLAADWSKGDKRWGHIGIVVADADGTLEVVHADTGKPGEGGAVRRVSLATFLSDVNDLGVYEVDLAGAERTAYLDYAAHAVGRPFDHGFSLDSDDSLYCSELVWRALSAGLGDDAVPDKSRRLGRVYVSVSDISENLHAHELRTVKAAPAGH